MNLFAWLVVGHLVGDWLLQTDWMASRKRLSPFNWALFVHCVIYTLAIVAAMRVALHLAGVGLPWYVGAVLLTFSSHWIVDASDLSHRWGRMIGQSDLEMVRVVVDQTFHVLVLAVLAEIVGRGI